jgi:peptidyl-tRNA hydrolase, PTH1 family
MSDLGEIESEALTKIIVGLGNPGDPYARNRHNIGFMVLDALAREAAGRWSDLLSSSVCRISICGEQVLLVEPMIYMNNSGKAVHALLSELRKSPEELLVIYDDLNLPLGRLRVRERGSAGGHHGLESILETFNTEEILRIRIGIGEEQMPEDKSEFVLSDFPPERQRELDEMIHIAGNAVQTILRDGASKTMALFNA